MNSPFENTDCLYAIMDFIDNDISAYSTQLSKHAVEKFIDQDTKNECSFVLEHACQLLHNKRDKAECLFRNILHIPENEELECDKQLNDADENAIIQFIFDPFAIFTNHLTFNKINQFIINILCNRNRNNKINKLLIEFATNDILNRRDILEQIDLQKQYCIPRQ
jgi:hypothetical protein